MKGDRTGKCEFQRRDYVYTWAKEESLEEGRERNNAELDVEHVE